MLSLPLTSADIFSRRFVNRPGPAGLSNMHSIDMGGDREGVGGGGGGGGQGPRTSPWKITSCHVFPRRKTGTNFHREAIPTAPVGVVWIRTRMSDGRIFYFHFLHVAYFLKLTDYADAQADLRLCCLHATKSSFSQQGTYGLG